MHLRVKLPTCRVQSYKHVLRAVSVSRTTLASLSSPQLGDRAAVVAFQFNATFRVLCFGAIHCVINSLSRSSEFIDVACIRGSFEVQTRVTFASFGLNANLDRRRKIFQSPETYTFRLRPRAKLPWSDPRPEEPQNTGMRKTLYPESQRPAGVYD